MRPFISRRAQKIKSFIAMDVLERSLELQKTGKSIISFSLGEPDFDPPACVEEALKKALIDKKTKYTHSQGDLRLRETIAERTQSRYGVKINPDQILVTQGTSPAFFLVFSTLLETGDEVILPNPHYPCDANFVSFLGGKNVFLPVLEKEQFQWNIAKTKKLITRKTRALFVTSPSNPTGAVLQKENIRSLVELGRPVVSDEIYHGLEYETPSHSALEFGEHVFAINGFSKAYAMTGYRLGYVIAPKPYIRALQKIQQNFYISANSFVQEAGIAALTQGAPDLERMRKEYKRRRDVLAHGLKHLGFVIGYQPDGAFYIFVNASHLSKNSYKLAFDILEKVGVAVTPGIDFGSRGEGYLRFSYAVSVEKIEEGLSRLKKYLENRK